MNRPLRLGLGAMMLVTALLVSAPLSAVALNPNHTCGDCHQIHGAPGGTLNIAADDGPGTPETAFDMTCLTCHGPAGTATEAAVHSNRSRCSSGCYDDPWEDDALYGPGHTETCGECHTPHSNLATSMGDHTQQDPPPRKNDPWPPPYVDTAVNQKLIGRALDASGFAKVRRPDGTIVEVVFHSRGSNTEVRLHSFADGNCDLDPADCPPLTDPVIRSDTGDGIYNGICEVCHTQVNHHSAAGDRTHNVGEQCTACHDHRLGFYK